MVGAISKSTVRIMKNNENLKKKKKKKKKTYKSCINLKVVAYGYKIENKQKCWMLDASRTVFYKITLVGLSTLCPSATKLLYMMIADHDI